VILLEGFLQLPPEREEIKRLRRQGFARRSSSAGNSKFDLCFVAGRRRKRRSGIGTMNKFNLPLRNIQKERRANRSEKRRLRSAAPSLKISVKPGPRSLSGKKKRKLEKKWRKTQKEALEGGLVTMEDIQMMAADEEDDQVPLQPINSRLSSRGFSMKKHAKLRLKSSKGAQVSEAISVQPMEAEVDEAMVQ